MLEFYEALRARLPEAESIVLSARAESMRAGTLEWLARHNLRVSDAHLCLVPNAAAKLEIWRHLAEDAPLIIIDDLSFNHERDQPSLYYELIRQAESIALNYVGLEQIAHMATDRSAPASIVEQVIVALPDPLRR